MSKITKNQRINQIADQLARQQGVISKLTIMVKEQNEAILMLEKLTDEKLRDQPKPQLKQLDQSVFDGLDEKWRFAIVSSVGIPFVYDYKPTGKRVMFSDDATQQKIKAGKVMRIDEYDYDTSDWQNSLIERESKELLEVDLSSELTGSELCKAMFARGATMIMCAVSNSHDQKRAITKQHEIDIIHDLESFVSSTHPYVGFQNSYRYATPINNQGEPLTAAEAGL